MAGFSAIAPPCMVAGPNGLVLKKNFQIQVKFKICFKFGLKKKTPAAEQSQVRKLKEIGDLGTRLCRCNSSHVRCIVSSEAPTSPPRLPRCTAWPLSLHLSSRSWHLVRLAGGHHRLRDLSIMFPGEFLLRDWDLDCDTLSLFFYLPFL
jgi:hypothetical protein